jgi:hypothetical protein
MPIGIDSELQARRATLARGRVIPAARLATPIGGAGILAFGAQLTRSGRSERWVPHS